MASFLIVKILDTKSIFIPSTSIFGDVELRSYKADCDEEISAFKESASSHFLDFNDHSICARISTIVNCQDEYDAIETSENSFSKVLDLKSVEFAISNFKTSKIGLIKNLNNGEIKPLLREDFEPSMSFLVNHGSMQCFDATNYILSINNDLSNRYLRSLHWARNSKHESNKQLKILFNWFALEALLKESEHDNIGGLIRWFLGFPNGKAIKEISNTIYGTLKKHPRYEFWSKELIAIIEKIRIFRNNSVHSGFRSAEFTKQELELYNKVMTFGTSRCQAAVNYALINQIQTVSELKEYIVSIFERDEYVISDTHNNIIYSLDNLK